MRKLIIPIILMIGIMFILAQFAELEDILLTLQRGRWTYLGLAVLVVSLWIVNVGASFRTIFRVLGIQEELGRLILIAAAATFVNIVAPSAGFGGMAVFIAEARARDYSVGRATVATTLYVLFDYLGFIAILTLGLVVLIRRDQLTPPEITATVVIVIIALILASTLYMGARSEQKLAQILAWLAERVNRVVKPFRKKGRGTYLSIERAYSFSKEIAEGIHEMGNNPKDLLIPFLLAVNGKVMMIVVLFFVFLAFDVPVSIGTLIAGFSVANLFMIVSPTPSGIGIVEGLLTLALSSFYIPLGTAAVITLAFRGFTFWLPLIFGLFAFRWVGFQPNNKAENPG